MKLLFDENLSPKLVAVLEDVFPESAHIHRLGLGGAGDDEVWAYAKENGFIVVSKDADFYDKSLLFGHPPKVIWIRRENCSNRYIQLLLRNKFKAISCLIANDELSFLQII
ncbi:MAG: DUF5615 family PIN-like protein [Methylococcales bacterium]|nr:DUF5615 family PIN-like protein [Methylococcales bacterium]